MRGNIMDAQRILDSEEFRKCAEFHGHICPGLSIGYRAAKLALDRIAETRAADEEIVAIVETDACSADAVQVLTGCTFGKGNFIYKDYGKMALTLLSRKSGQGVRVSMRPDAFAPDERHYELLRKAMNGQADEEEKKQFHNMHQHRSNDVLEMPDDELFIVKKVQMELPAKARIEPSVLCAKCGEPTMASKLELVDGISICRGCLS
jgi:formylmethanofuran dehydrogenase subunit E